jgi:type II secretory pathway pseudopilin PulG
MQGTIRQQLRGQRGISLIGLIFVLAILGVVLITAAKILPTFIEYRAIKNSIASAKSQGGTMREMQAAFDRGAEINTIEAIHGTDLIISKETGETEISFAYEKRIPLVANATLLLEYSGTTAKNGVVAQKPDADPK